MQRQLFIALLYGWIFVFSFILLSSIILALLFRFTAFNENSLAWIALTIGFVTLFIGGFIAGAKGKMKGWIIGGLTGLGFTLFTFLVQYLGYQHGFSMEQTFTHLGYMLASVIGGVIGVNIFGSRNE
ncbi:TIGR04086 family membrane protein [Oceanobacillus chungangensis]|uniref:TIGR04086 family membrane protein n=1 Tax=Oceanobacillus chungangensis TaxID=1229152 RepID=A0A3D8Q3C3_9BACI|nr:TIGR04086 family membrane protein [Oceanobacillus chungangensis]RDW21685.1 TIGR04086 family membrane protein [Oceanobacillus chungangensis]